MKTEENQDIEQLLAAVQPAPLPADLQQRVLRAVARTRRARRIRRGLTWGAAAVIALILSLSLAAHVRDQRLLTLVSRPRPPVMLATGDQLRREYGLPVIVHTGRPEPAPALQDRIHTIETLLKGSRNGS